MTKVTEVIEVMRATEVTKIWGRSFIMSYRLGVGGGKQKYDTL